MKRIFKYCTSLIFVSLLFSCEYYLGFDQQPKFSNEHIEEGLNIFGLLRPDSLEGYNKSFVYVHQVMPVMEAEGFNILQNVNVRIEKIIEKHIAESLEFPLVPSNTVFADTSYRPLTFFAPQSGEHYRIICSHEGFPDAVGETIIPRAPEIQLNTLSVSDKMVSFTLAPDSLIGMIDIYQCMNDVSIPVSRLVPSELEETHVVLNLPFPSSDTRLLLYSYDHNMAVYIGNSNISLNFNKFRKTISTLESGFGVFGAMNFCEVGLGEGDER